VDSTWVASTHAFKNSSWPGYPGGIIRCRYGQYDGHQRGTAYSARIFSIWRTRWAFWRLLGINYTLYPQLGNLVTKGFIASVIGGLGSMSGAVIGAVLLGVIETLLINFIGSGYAPVFTFLIMLVFLLVHPQGIAGSNVQEKA